MIIAFTSFSLLGAVSAGINLGILADRRGTPVNGAAVVMGAVAAVYFAARSHGWVP